MDRQKMLQHNIDLGHWQGVDTNINADRLVDTLINSTTGRGPNPRAIKDLIGEMENHGWTVSAGLHAGGLGGGGRGADPRPHITLQVHGRQYHLHYHFIRGVLLITDITA